MAELSFRLPEPNGIDEVMAFFNSFHDASIACIRVDATGFLKDAPPDQYSVYLKLAHDNYEAAFRRKKPRQEIEITFAGLSRLHIGSLPEVDNMVFSFRISQDGGTLNVTIDELLSLSCTEIVIEETPR